MGMTKTMDEIYEYDEIRQLIPIPECLTPMELMENEEGNDVYADSSGYVFYALLRDKDTVFYSFSTNDPQGEFAGSVYLVQTVHCKNCGQRMAVDDIPAGSIPNRHQLIYRCPCGTTCHPVSSRRGVYEWNN